VRSARVGVERLVAHDEGTVRHDERQPEHRDRQGDREYRDGVLDVRLHRPILLKPALGRSLNAGHHGRCGLPRDYFAATEQNGTNDELVRRQRKRPAVVREEESQGVRTTGEITPMRNGEIARHRAPRPNEGMRLRRFGAFPEPYFKSKSEGRLTRA
jgi:hypothetical protein